MREWEEFSALKIQRVLKIKRPENLYLRVQDPGDGSFASLRMTWL